MHAICDRVEPRDFVEFWAMLHRGTPTVSNDVLERRLRRLMDDLVAHDPRLGPEQLGRALERGLDRDLLEGFALRLLQPVSSDDVQQAILRSLTVISRIVRQGWSGPTASGPGSRRRVAISRSRRTMSPRVSAVSPRIAAMFTRSAVVLRRSVAITRRMSRI
jgi:hypothetical protein